MTRREAAEKVFNYIRENKFEPTNIQYGDGYFIFDMGADGVVHFKIKGLHGWKFAMWIETDAEKLKREDNRRDGKDYPAIQFFCQHELNIDKFKPSRSFHLVELSLEDVENGENWRFMDIRDMLQMIKRHPLVAFTMDACEDKYYHKSYLSCYLDMKTYRIKQAIKEWWNDTWVRVWHGSKVWFINRYKVVDKAELVDNNSDDWKVSPRYDMRIHFKKISDNTDIQEKAEINMLDFWFHDNYYNNMSLGLTREGHKGRYYYTMSK